MSPLRIHPPVTGIAAGRRLRRGRTAAAFLALVTSLLPAGSAEPGPIPALPGSRRGQELAAKYCASCHLVPEPGSLTKSAWVHQIQPEMAKWFGLAPVDFEGMTDGRLLQEAGIYPPSPILPEEDWFAIWDYYRTTAPSQLPAAQPAEPVQIGLKRFKVRKLNPHSGVPMTCLVHIDAPRHQILVGDAFGGSLFVLGPGGQVQRRARFSSPPVGVFDSGHDTLLLTLIGRLFPADSLEGSVVLWDRQNGTPPDPVLENLRRPTDAVLVDLNQDGLKDVVTCSFGHRLGHFSWFE